MASGWTLNERVRIMLSNWIEGEVPNGLVEDVLLFAELYGEQAKRERQDQPATVPPNAEGVA